MNIAHVLTVAFTLTLGSAGCFSVGSPAYSCRKKVPGHVNDATEGPAPYSITVTRTVIQPGQATRGEDNFFFKTWIYQRMSMLLCVFARS